MSAHDVVVVGGGPAGSVTAGLLARRGYDVVLLDRAKFPRDKACAEYCSPGVESALRRINAWDLIERELPRRLQGMFLCFDGSRVMPVQYEAAGRRAFSFSLPRSRFDHALLRYAVRCGVIVAEGRRARTVHVDSKAVTVETRTPDGSHETYTGRVVVGADGMHSQVARSVGVTSTSQWPRRLGLVAHYEGVTGFDDWGEMHVGDEVYCGLNPLPDGLLNVGLVVPLAEGRQGKLGVEALFHHSVAKMPGVAARLDHGTRVKPIRGMGPMSRHVKPVSGQGYILVGDAAGFIDPFTGEGIYRSICGAEIAAQAIDDGLTKVSASTSGSLPDLSTYATHRKREFIAKERVTWIIQSALAMPPALEVLCGRVSASSEARRVLGNILGDTAPARALLRPRVAAALLKPW